MTINDLEFFLVQIWCEGRRSKVSSHLVRLATDTGLEGWGEAWLGWRASELDARRDALLPILAGRSIFDVEDLLAVDELTSKPLRCALETACWDMIGRAAGQPLCHLLGGNYRHRIPMAVRLDGATDQENATLAKELADQGFHTQIVSGTGQVEQDLSRLAAVRESVGERVELRLDAAAGYDVDAARELCTELESDGLQFVLDPLESSELGRTAELRRQTSVPLAVGRAIGSPSDMIRLVRRSAAEHVVIDLQTIGGISAARQSVAIAGAAEVGASLGGGPSLGIRTAAVLHLAASSPAFSSCNECAYHQLQDDLLSQPLEIVDGLITVPRSPGLGIEVDRGKVEKYSKV